MPLKIPKAKQKSRDAEEGGDIEEGHDPHGVINPLEAKFHVDTLDQTMEMIQERVDTDNTKDIAETAIEMIKATLASTLPMMQDANMATVVKAMKDCSFKVLLPRPDKVEQILEEIFPTEELPQAVDMVQVAKAEEPIMETDQRLMAKLFVRSHGLAIVIDSLCDLRNKIVTT